MHYTGKRQNWIGLVLKLWSKIRIMIRLIQRQGLRIMFVRFDLDFGQRL